MPRPRKRQRTELSAANTEVVKEKSSDIITTLNEGRNEAAYNKTAQRYRITVTLESDQPFTVIPTSVKDGLLRDRDVLLLNKDPPKDKPSRLLSLPPELRTKIFKHVFGKDDLVYWIRGTRNHNLQACRSHGKTIREHFCHGHHWRASVPSAIFAVCQQIKAEALPIFYGNIEFRFDCSKFLKNFLEHIGSSVVYLRHIYCYSFRTCDITSCLLLLEQATNLKSLRTIGIDWTRDYSRESGNDMRLMSKLRSYDRRTNTHPIANGYDDCIFMQRTHWWHLIKSMLASGKNLDEVFSIIRFEDEKLIPGECTCCKKHKSPDSACTCIAAGEAFLAWLEGIKKKAREQLDLETKLEQEAARKAAKLEEDDFSYLEPVMAAPRRDTGRPRRRTTIDKNISYFEED